MDFSALKFTVIVFSRFHNLQQVLYSAVNKMCGTSLSSADVRSTMTLFGREV